jgi:4-amino-4-deoxy-L-arabinose transferase-like glycosyltransferase
MAGRSAQAALLLLLVAVALDGVDRLPRVRRPRSSRWLSLRRLRPAVTAAEAAGGLVVATVAVAVRVIWAPPALPPGYAAIVDSISRGSGFRAGHLGPATAVHPPLAPFLAALVPGGPRVLAIAAGLAALLAVVVLANRLFGREVAWVVAAVMAVAPAAWGQQLPEALATALVMVGLVLVDPTQPIGRPVLAGFVLGCAVLTRPEAAVVVLVAAVWVVLVRRTDRWRVVAVLLVVAAVVVTPWELRMHRDFGTWRPATNLGATLYGATTRNATHGEGIGTWDARGVFAAPASRLADEAGRDGALLRASRSQLRRVTTPVIGARVLRGLDLWPHRPAARARSARGLPLPGGTAGTVVEALVSLLALATAAFGFRRHWRDALPVVALPALFVVESAALFGDRGLRALAAPMFVLLAAHGAMRLADWLRWHRTDRQLLKLLAARH